MQISNSILVLCTLLPALGFAAPAASSANSKSAGAKATPAPNGGQDTKATSSSASPAATGPANGGNGTAPGKAGGVTDTQINNAVMGWMNDTGKVTNFLNKATSFSGDEYTRQATIALNAEVDELNHKKVLDEALGTSEMVQTANATLEGKQTFQAVVDVLQAMVNNGPDTAQAQVDEINKNRCVNVLPNINMYFAAAGSPTVSAVVPTGCLEVAATSAPASSGGAPPPAADQNKDKAQDGNQGGNGTAPATGSPAQGGNGTAPATGSPAQGGNGTAPATGPPAQGGGNRNGTAPGAANPADIPIATKPNRPTGTGNQGAGAATPTAKPAAGSKMPAAAKAKPTSSTK